MLHLYATAFVITFVSLFIGASIVGIGFGDLIFANIVTALVQFPAGFVAFAYLRKAGLLPH
jgi:hypothetical protein